MHVQLNRYSPQNFQLRAVIQCLTNCYSPIISNVVPNKTEWKRQHITQQNNKTVWLLRHILQVFASHDTHSESTCNSQSTVKVFSELLWQNYAQLHDDNKHVMYNYLYVTCRKKLFTWAAADWKHAFWWYYKWCTRIVTWEEFRAYLICMQHGNFHTCHRPTLLLLCTTAHEHHKINSPQSLYTATLHASTGGYALWTLSWRLSTQSCIANNASRIYATCTTMIVRCVYVRMHECTMHKPSHLMYMYM